MPSIEPRHNCFGFLHGSGTWRTVRNLVTEGGKLDAGDTGTALHPLVVDCVEDAYVASFGNADIHVPECVREAGIRHTAVGIEELRQGLPAGELALLTGLGSVGKGVLTMQIGAALAYDRLPFHTRVALRSVRASGAG